MSVPFISLPLVISLLGSCPFEAYSNPCQYRDYFGAEVWQITLTTFQEL